MTELAHCIKHCSTVFLDRDGTINAKAPEEQYIMSPDQLVLLPGTGAAVSKLNAAGLRVILVTNQRWLSTQRDQSGYARVKTRLDELLAAEGARIDATYCCPHALGSCDCRKPSPGMLRRAAEEHQFSLSEAVMIGDSEMDITAGRAAGTTTILLCSGRQIPFAGADFVTDSLAKAVCLILNPSNNDRDLDINGANDP